MSIECKQVGTVEVLAARVYALDPSTADPSTFAVVEPGVYPLYELGDARFWVMDGTLNVGGLQKIGDGLLISTPYDEASDIPVKFPTRSWGPRQWKEFVAEETALEGHKDQRIRIQMEVPK